MPDTEQTILDRIADFAARELGAPAFDLLAPSVLEAAVDWLAGLSPETKAALGYVICRRILGAVLVSGPGGTLAPLKTWLVAQGVTEAQAVGMVSKALTALDEAIEKHRPLA